MSFSPPMEFRNIKLKSGLFYLYKIIFNMNIISYNCLWIRKFGKKAKSNKRLYFKIRVPFNLKNR